MLCGLKMHMVMEDISKRSFTVYKSNEQTQLAKLADEIVPKVSERWTDEDVIAPFILVLQYDNQFKSEKENP